MDLHSIAKPCDVRHLICGSILEMGQEYEQVRMTSLDSPSQCRVVALQNVVRATTVVAYTKTFWTDGELVNPLPVDVGDHLLDTVDVWAVRVQRRLYVRHSSMHVACRKQRQTDEAVYSVLVLGLRLLSLLIR